jgi:FkbM family methyltransferase
MDKLPPTKEEIGAVLRLAIGPKQVGVVFDCGSRDARDGVDLVRVFHAKELHVFEPNPAAMALCRRTAAANTDIPIILNQVALGDKLDKVTFRPIDPDRTETQWADGNIGASSLFEADKSYPYESYVQRQITVDMITLDFYCLTHSKPDLLWIDVQGAELMLFRGAEETLRNVRVIHVELSFRPLYHGQPLYWEVDRYLRARGFRRVGFEGISWWRTLLARLRLPRPRVWQANVIYAR